jgi:hypothetical protein
MPQVTIEYMIMIPLLILQIFLFPYTANLIMNGWTDSRRILELQEIAGHIGSSIVQLYTSLNHDTISVGTVTTKVGVPLFIENYAYTGNGTLRSATDSTLNSSKILDITLTISGTQLRSVASVTLGENVQWINSTYISNSTNACINGQKLSNGTVQFYFGS